MYYGDSREQGEIQMNILTYHSEDAPSHKAWIAYPCIDGLFLVRCEAATKEEAVARAERWYSNEQAKQDRIVGDSEQEPSTFNRVMGQGHHFAGKVWVLNRETGHKTRVMPNRVNEYLDSGYVKAGPRSK
jgi:hypothetical protein